eukprot:5842005-Prymnesium_polylepis.1
MVAVPRTACEFSRKNRRRSPFPSSRTTLPCSGSMMTSVRFDGRARTTSMRGVMLMRSSPVKPISELLSDGPCAGAAEWKPSALTLIRWVLPGRRPMTTSS